ncbi:MAG: hypothetical protein ACM3N1_00035 [Accumulibacter sp.]
MKKKFTIQLLALMVIMAFLSLPLTLKGQDSKANYSGKWVLNAEKSHMVYKGGGRLGGGNFTAKQEGNVLNVDQAYTDRASGEEKRRLSKYILDGKERLSEETSGSKSAASWSADGKSLTIKSTFEFVGKDGKVATRTEVWNLTSPNSLTITLPGRDGGDASTTIAVYDKK